jgi:hypothetical protein
MDGLVVAGGSIDIEEIVNRNHTETNCHVFSRCTVYSTKRNGSNFQDLPLAEMLKPDAQGDAPGDDAPEDAAAPAADAPKVRLGACSGGNTDAIGFMRNLLDLHFSLYPASSHALVPACSLKFNQLGAYNQHFPWFLIDIIPTAAMVRRCPGVQGSASGARGQGIGEGIQGYQG